VAGLAAFAPQLTGLGRAPAGTVVGSPGEGAVRPSPTVPATSAPLGADGEWTTPDSWPAFFSAGYDYDDAVALAALWGSATVEDAKTRAGEELLAGATLPVAPGSAPPAPGTSPSGDDATAVEAFFAAGYDYDDAVALARLWGGDPYEAKVTAGQKLTAGETLPVAP